MSVNSIDKEVKKRTDVLKEAKIENFLVGKTHTIIILICAGVMFAGLIMQLFSKNATVKAVGFGMILAGTVGILLAFLSVKRRGPLSYSSYFFLDREDNEVVLQVLSSKWMIYAYKNLVVEYKNGGVRRIKERYMPDADWQCFKDATFTEKGEYNKHNVWYKGEREKDGKVQKIRLTFKDGALDFIECDKIKMRHYPSRDTKFTVMIPPPLYMAIEVSKLKLPEGSHLILKRLHTNK